MRRLDVSLLAERDIDSILDWSGRRFGSRSRAKYGRLIRRALSNVPADPRRTGTRTDEGLAPGLALHHLRHARRDNGKDARIDDPRHLLLFEHDDERVLILRVLHDAMDLPAHLPRRED